MDRKRIEAKGIADFQTIVSAGISNQLLRMVTDDNAASGESPQAPRINDAVFTGWQTTGSGESFALYTIIAADHPSRGSTVSANSLLNLNLKIPLTPGRSVNKP